MKPAKEQKEAQSNAQKSAKWVPPRGIRFLPAMLDCPANPYPLRWTVDHKRRTKNFPTETARLAFAKSLAADMRNNGVSAYRLDPDEAREWRAFRARIGEASLDDVFATWERHRSKRPSGAKLEALRVQYMELRDREGGLSLDARRHIDLHLIRFCGAFGGHGPESVSPADVRGWMLSLKDKHDEPIGPQGQRDHLKNVRTFFSYIHREEWASCAENPCARVVAPKTDEGDPVVIPVQDAIAFFKANENEAFIGRLALEAFGGLRTGTAGKIQKAGINFDQLGIRMSAGIHKTGLVDGRSRYRQKHPPNLWEWLKRAPDACWGLTRRQYQEAKKLGGIQAGIRPASNISDRDDEVIRGLKNIWRHSFISYHLAAFQDPPLTQRLAQHMTYAQTEEYEGLCTHEDATKYFGIKPSR